jgi:hypothetical protein
MKTLLRSRTFLAAATLFVAAGAYGALAVVRPAPAEKAQEKLPAARRAKPIRPPADPKPWWQDPEQARARAMDHYWRERDAFTSTINLYDCRGGTLGAEVADEDPLAPIRDAFRKLGPDAMPGHPQFAWVKDDPRFERTRISGWHGYLLKEPEPLEDGALLLTLQFAPYLRYVPVGGFDEREALTNDGTEEQWAYGADGSLRLVSCDRGHDTRTLWPN